MTNFGPVKLGLVSSEGFLGNHAQENRGPMEQLKLFVTYFIDNGPALAATVLAVLSASEMVVRLTPTTKDDTAVERVGKFIRRMFDLLGVPNMKAGGGVHPKIEEKELPK